MVLLQIIDAAASTICKRLRREFEDWQGSLGLLGVLLQIIGAAASIIGDLGCENSLVSSLGVLDVETCVWSNSLGSPAFM